jgi:RNA polymerase sporulation-specific sigma factor
VSIKRWKLSRRMEVGCSHYFPHGCVISLEILMFLRASKKSRNEVYLYDPIGTDKEGNEITLIDILGTDPDAVSDLVEKFFESRLLLDKMKKLSKREKAVLEMRYGIGDKPRKTQREIASIFNISRSYVSRIEKKAINKLFQEFNQNNHT